MTVDLLTRFGAIPPSPPDADRLHPGEVIEYERRHYLVQHVNDSRAYCVPIQGRLTSLADPVSGRVRTFTTYGDGVNISPYSAVPRIKPGHLSDEEKHRMDTQIAQTPVSLIPPTKTEKRAKPPKNNAIPLGTKKAPTEKVVAAKAAAAEKKAKRAQQEADRKAKVAAAKEARKAERAAKAKAPRPEKQVKPCKCGCGEQVTGHFAQGHDARFKGWLLKVERGQMEVKDLPKAVQTGYKWVKRGDGYIPTTNYKGEAHKGYDTGK